MAYQNFFASRLYTDIGAGDTTITLEQAPTATVGRMVLEARNPTQREIITYSGVSGNQLTGVVRGVGGTSAKSHLKTALIEMNLTAEDISDLYAAFLSFAPSGNGWLNTVSVLTTASGYNQGQKEFNINSSLDLTSILSPGMRLKITRGTAAPTQCADLESSSSQHAHRTASITGAISTFTDDITAEAWIKLESYGGNHAIVSRYNGTNGWEFLVQGNGRIYIIGFNSGNTNYRQVISTQAIPLNRWIHVAGTLDMNGWTAATNKIFIDGVDVPADLNSSGSNPTALIQAGNLAIGSSNGGNFLDGKVADVRVWGVVRTATQIRDNTYQQLVGNEANLIGYWKLNGDFNDSTASANHLTGQAGAVATNVDNPLKTIEYAIITKVTAGVITVFTGTDHGIPLGVTLGSPQYSSAKAPYGFPATINKWFVETFVPITYGISSPVTGTWYNNGNNRLAVPLGSWKLGYSLNVFIDSSGQNDGRMTLSTSSSAETDKRFTAMKWVGTGTETKEFDSFTITDYVDLTSQTFYYLLLQKSSATAASWIYAYGDPQPVKIVAECGYF